MEKPIAYAELRAAADISAQPGSPLALAGLMWGVGVLDPVEVLRYLDATFRDYPGGEEGKAE
jgi:hypothetical protein